MPNGTTGTACVVTDLGGNFCVGNDVNAAGQIVTGSDIFHLANNGRHGLRWAVTLTPSNSERCLADLEQLINDLRGRGALSDGDANSLLAKLEDASGVAHVYLVPAAA